jgi:hypothetical protein
MPLTAHSSAGEQPAWSIPHVERTSHVSRTGPASDQDAPAGIRRLGGRATRTPIDNAVMLTALVLAAALVPQAPARPASVHAKDACALLTDDEAFAVLGVRVTERHPGTQQAQGLLLRQCHLGTGTARSISLAVAGSTTSGGTTVSPHEFWREQFHAGRRGKNKGARGRDSDRAARAIAGIGEEAFWSGNRIAGALYVLQGRTFLRVSVGGIPDERERIEKSTAVARTALKRL